MKLIGAALGVHGDDAAGIPAAIRGQNTALHTKLSDAVRRRDGAIHRVELGVLQLVPVHRDAGAIHLSARDGIGVSIVGDQVSRISQRRNLVAEWSLALNLRNHTGQIERVAVELRQLRDHLVIKNRGGTGLIRLHQRG